MLARSSSEDKEGAHASGSPTAAKAAALQRQTTATGEPRMEVSLFIEPRHPPKLASLRIPSFPFHNSLSFPFHNATQTLGSNEKGSSAVRDHSTSSASR